MQYLAPVLTRGRLGLTSKYRSGSLGTHRRKGLRVQGNDRPWINAGEIGDDPVSVVKIDRTWRKGGYDNGPLMRVIGFDMQCRGKLVYDNQAKYSWWDTLGLYHEPLVGLRFNRDEYLDQAEPSRPVIFAPEPFHPYDSKAVGVWLADGQRIGYIRKDGTRSLRQVMRSGPVCAAVWKVRRYVERAGPPSGIEVMVFRPGSLANAPTPVHPEWTE